MRSGNTCARISSTSFVSMELDSMRSLSHGSPPIPMSAPFSLYCTPTISSRRKRATSRDVDHIVPIQISMSVLTTRLNLHKTQKITLVLLRRPDDGAYCFSLTDGHIAFFRALLLRTGGVGSEHKRYQSNADAQSDLRKCVHRLFSSLLLFSLATAAFQLCTLHALLPAPPTARAGRRRSSARFPWPCARHR